eukprot:TRINITY_DN5927_c0_g1_i1.p1 TRINITY_DN5927_c0_g1~~TRINITY_DN5927_c0_g1_i1.p1  ORF type:complete len:148 (+),score=31.11 TRINITY_DN5927_c0_g1_i1:53-496(+)
MSDDKEHKKPSVTTDAGVLKVMQDNKIEVLLVKRGRPPFEGKLAFPGGFVDENEDPLKGCVRELKEETSLEGKNPQLIGVYGDPKRDPRGHVISIFYHVDVSNYDDLKGGDDAADASFYPVEKIKDEDLAFDHAKLLKDLLSFHKRK